MLVSSQHSPSFSKHQRAKPSPFLLLSALSQFHRVCSGFRGAQHTWISTAGSTYTCTYKEWIYIWGIDACNAYICHSSKEERKRQMANRSRREQRRCIAWWNILLLLWCRRFVDRCCSRRFDFLWNLEVFRNLRGPRWCHVILGCKASCCCCLQASLILRASRFALFCRYRCFERYCRGLGKLLGRWTSHLFFVCPSRILPSESPGGPHRCCRRRFRCLLFFHGGFRGLFNFCRRVFLHLCCITAFPSSVCDVFSFWDHLHMQLASFLTTALYLALQVLDYVQLFFMGWFYHCCSNFYYSWLLFIHYLKNHFHYHFQMSFLTTISLYQYWQISLSFIDSLLIINFLFPMQYYWVF